MQKVLDDERDRLASMSPTDYKDCRQFASRQPIKKAHFSAFVTKQNEKNITDDDIVDPSQSLIIEAPKESSLYQIKRQTKYGTQPDITMTSKASEYSVNRDDD